MMNYIVIITKLWTEWTIFHWGVFCSPEVLHYFHYLTDWFSTVSGKMMSGLHWGLTVKVPSGVMNSPVWHVFQSNSATITVVPQKRRLCSHTSHSRGAKTNTTNWLSFQKEKKPRIHCSLLAPAPQCERVSSSSSIVRCLPTVISLALLASLSRVEMKQ